VTADYDVMPAPRRRRRRPEEIRGLILESAWELFELQGYDATKDIARRAGVLESLLFTNFGSKAALFDAAVVGPFAALVAEYAAAWDLHASKSTPEHGRAGMGTYLRENPRDNRPPHRYPIPEGVALADARRVYARYQAYFDVPTEWPSAGPGGRVARQACLPLSRGSAARRGSTVTAQRPRQIERLMRAGGNSSTDSRAERA